MHEDEAKRSAGLYTVERQGAARTGGVRVPEEEEQKPYPAQCQEHRVCYGTAVSSFLLGKFTYSVSLGTEQNGHESKRGGEGDRGRRSCASGVERVRT